MTTKLSLFNDALLACGERALGSLTENRESRRLLDQVYASGGIEYCLERGQWGFATRTIQLDYDPGIETDFGFRRAFEQPTDWVNTRAVCADEYFRVPLNADAYSHEGQYFYSDLDTIYIKYVSNDPLYGLNLNKWSKTFQEVVAIHFAAKIVKKLAGSEEQKMELEKQRDRLLTEAENADAQRDGTQFPAPGSWVKARASGRSRDGGSNGSLIG